MVLTLHLSLCCIIAIGLVNMMCMGNDYRGEQCNDMFWEVMIYFSFHPLLCGLCNFCVSFHYPNGGNNICFFEVNEVRQTLTPIIF